MDRLINEDAVLALIDDKLAELHEKIKTAHPTYHDDVLMMAAASRGVVKHLRREIERLPEESYTESDKIRMFAGNPANDCTAQLESLA